MLSFRLAVQKVRQVRQEFGPNSSLGVLACRNFWAAVRATLRWASRNVVHDAARAVSADSACHDAGFVAVLVTGHGRVNRKRQSLNEPALVLEAKVTFEQTHLLFRGLCLQLRQVSQGRIAAGIWLS